MVRINLLPWREQLREERKRNFVIALMFTAVVGAGLVFLASQILNLQIDNQNNRNNYLQNQIGQMNEQIRQIEELKKEKAKMIAQTKVIEDLQSNRQIAARLLDQFVQTLPDGVFYTSLAKKGKNINISGITASNNKVSELLRKFEGSSWLANPDLTEIIRLNKNNEADKTARFVMAVDQADPKDTELPK